MHDDPLPVTESERWEWLRNPLSPKAEHPDFAILRRDLAVDDDQCIAPGYRFADLSRPAQQRLNRVFPQLIDNYNPFIRRIIRRTCQQLEEQIDPETNEPLLKRIEVELLGEQERDAIILSPYLREAYSLAQDFCAALGQRLQAAGFLKILLLRRIGSTIHAGRMTAQRMLGDWEHLESDEDDEEISDEASSSQPATASAHTLPSSPTATTTHRSRRILHLPHPTCSRQS